MVRMRNLVKVGNREVKKRYIGNKLIFEDLGDKTEALSGEEIYTDNADDAVVHVAVDGKSYQGGVPTPDHPIEIHSLNDFDVVSSVGRKNLIKNSDFRDGLSGWRTNGSEYVALEDSYVRVNSGRSSAGLYQNISSIEVGDTVTLSALIRGSGNIRLGLHRSDSTEIEIPSDWKRVSATITKTGTGVAVTFYTSDVYSYFDIRNVQVEFGTQATPYSPSPIEITESDNNPLIDKINFSLSEPLRSVGDVKDRIFRDSDGLWKIERNVGEFVVAGGENIVVSNHGNNTQTYAISINATNLLYIDPSINMTQSSHYVGRSWRNVYSGQDGIAMDRSHIRVRDGRFSYDINLFRTWLSEQHAGGNPLTVQYHIESTVELLSQELQDKLNNLRSFENSNYVYAVINDKTDILPTVAENLKPTLHATFKSKGWYDYYLKTLLK